jgi:hypothetical protein
MNGQKVAILLQKTDSKTAGIILFFKGKKSKKPKTNKSMGL